MKMSATVLGCGVLATSVWLMLRVPLVGQQAPVPQTREGLGGPPVGASGPPVRRVVVGLPDWLTDEFRAKLGALDDQAAVGLDERTYHLRRAHLFEEEVRRLSEDFESNDFLLSDVARMRLHISYERFLAGLGAAEYEKLRFDYLRVLASTADLWVGQGRMTAAESLSVREEFERTFPLPK